MLRELSPSQRVEAELTIVSKVGDILASSLEPSLTLPQVAQLLVPRLADCCTIELLDERGRVTRAAAEVREGEPLLTGPAGTCPGPTADELEQAVTAGASTLIRSPTECRVTDPAAAKPLFPDLPVRSYLVAPLMLSGRSLGALIMVQAGSRRHFDDADAAFLHDIARRIGLYVSNAQLFRSTERQRETLEALNQVGTAIAAQLDRDALVQLVTDAATRLSGAQFGAFFYNVVNERQESYMLYALSGAPRSAFERFPMPRNTAVFAPTFNGLGIVRLDDITQSPDYGKSAPYHGMPEGHLPVRSYLAVPVISRSKDVIGGLFFGHSEPGVFSERSEQYVVGLAAQAAIAMDNVQLFSRAKELIADLERTNRELDQFAYVASHDLKAPLRAISTLTQFLEDDVGPQLPPEAKSHLSLMRDRVRRMESLIQGILEYSRAGRVRAKPERVEVAQLIKEVCELLNTKAVEVVGPLPVVTTIKTQLEQVFLNLIGNALKHGKSGGEVPVRVQVSAVEQERTLEFIVSDDGQGIAPEYHDRIFGIFQTLGGPGSSENTGIGLAVVKRIIESKGGAVRVESGLGTGATFRFTWPKEEDG